MTETIERPIWATRTHLDTDGTPYTYEADVLITQSIDGIENMGAGWSAGPMRYTLIQGASQSDPARMCDPYGLDFQSPDDMRAYADELKKAAEQWERVMGGME